MAEFVGNYTFKSIAEQEYADKLLLLAATMEKQTQKRLVADKLDCAANIANTMTKIRLGKKYDKIDIGTSGRLMVERATGIVYGIKGYGKVHKGHIYGTLDTIGDWYWGLYYPIAARAATTKKPAENVIVAEKEKETATIVQFVTPTEVKVTDEIRRKQCSICLWAGCECVKGSKLSTEDGKTCKAYTYYD